MKNFTLPINFLYYYFDARVIGRIDQLWQFWFKTDYEPVSIKREDIEKYIVNMELLVESDEDYHAKKIAKIVLERNFGKVELIVIDQYETSITTGFHTIGAYEYLNITDIPVQSVDYDQINVEYLRYLSESE